MHFLNGKMHFLNGKMHFLNGKMHFLKGKMRFLIGKIRFPNGWSEGGSARSRTAFGGGFQWGPRRGSPVLLISSGVIESTFVRNQGNNNISGHFPESMRTWAGGRRRRSWGRTFLSRSTLELPPRQGRASAPEDEWLE